MSIDIDNEVAAMGWMSIGELREKYERVFGETTRTRHAACLIRRIAWRMQANELGGLSERARQRALDLADEADLRMTAPSPAPPPANGRTVSHPAPAPIRNAVDEPTVGTQLVRRYKGQDIVVTIAENGVRWKGELYNSLTAVAEAVTGSHWNGKAFFKLTRRTRS
jgi:hypothetical protein